MKIFILGLVIAALGECIFWSPIFHQEWTLEQQQPYAAAGLIVMFIGACLALFGSYRKTA